MGLDDSRAAPVDDSLAGTRSGGSEKIMAIDARSRNRSERREELAWIRSAQAGSAEAVEALFRRHWRRAYRAAYLVVRDESAAEDIAQEAFIAALGALERFDRRRPFGPWLHRIVVNRAIDWARARSLRGELAERAGAERRPVSGSADDVDLDELGVALESLPPEQRAVIVMRHLLDYTPGEIAAMLELPRGTVNSRLRRGLDTLAASLGEDAS
jgi:RNA polymerase sigma-70 factor (ECF subfamily)